MSGRKKAWVKSAFSQLSCDDADSNTSPTVAKRICTRSKSLIEAGESSSQKDNKKVRETIVPFCGAAKASGNVNWIDSFAPTTAADLATHVKKVEELENWLQHCTAVHKEQPAQLCLITGPPGAGKTAAVRVLAAKYHYSLQEWINPIDCEVVTTLGDTVDGAFYVRSQIETFKSFLIRASRYRSLQDQYKKRLLLVEDFPNSLISNAATFESILEDYQSYGKSPVIFVITDTKSRALNISYKLFSDQIQQRFNVHRIIFNPIAVTLLQKAMKRFCTLMRQEHAGTYQAPTQSIIDSIITSAQGDVRNALINLHFASLKGAPGVLTQHVANDQNLSTRKKQSTLKSVGCDESITMFHALGRVFNPKYTEQKKFVHCPEKIAEDFGTEPKKFVDFMHANYLSHFKDTEQLIGAADGISLADVMLCEYRESEVGNAGFNIAVRALMVSNSAPVGGWKPTHAPKRLIVTSPVHGNANISRNLYATDYNTYVKVIESKTF